MMQYWQYRLKGLTHIYESLLLRQKPLQAKSYIPEIKECCEELGLEWSVYLGIEDGYLYASKTVQEPSLSVEKPLVAVQEENINKCLHCKKELKGKRKDAKYCDDVCRSQYHHVKKNN
ncbi:hypothetical protein [Flectobacillus roseus]|uniref:hypothetical protein n=1 Tax=Flectobacillus roseus TaxID=502259 RepID=UPI0024B83FCD|nr:hypothetical protein [Flectobacillus roseus]MDI9870600.1 hypothetical protein [Flectobacillus roseus]